MLLDWTEGFTLLLLEWLLSLWSWLLRSCCLGLYDMTEREVMGPPLRSYVPVTTLPSSVRSDGFRLMSTLLMRLTMSLYSDGGGDNGVFGVGVWASDEVVFRGVLGDVVVPLVAGCPSFPKTNFGSIDSFLIAI